MDWNQCVYGALLRAIGDRPPLPYTPPDAHWLLRLDPIIWSSICPYLDYIDILNLACLNKEFKTAHVENYLPWTVRHAAITKRDREAATIASRHGTKRQAACYLCFRMKDVAEFQRTNETVTFARVERRNVYTGARTFQPVPPPSPSQINSVVLPPSIPSSPGTIGMGMVGSGVAMGMSSGPGIPNMYPQQLIPFARRSRWVPDAPGAQEGQVESLRQYCLPCALESHLATPGDAFTTMTGVKMWVCHCWEARVREAVVKCPVCHMMCVLRD